MNQAVFFTNFSTEDFSHTWDGVVYTFRAGSTMMLQDYLANHFAKHLVDRELNKLGVLTNSAKRQEFLEKCFIGETIKAESEAEIEMKVLNVNAEEAEQTKEDEETVKSEPDLAFCEFCDSKGVRHKRDCTRPVDSEEEFAGLKE